MEEKDPKKLKCVFCFIKEDGTLSDITGELLEHDEIITNELERLGIIKRFIVGDIDPEGK